MSITDPIETPVNPSDAAEQGTDSAHKHKKLRISKSKERDKEKNKENPETPASSEK